MKVAMKKREEYNERMAHSICGIDIETYIDNSKEGMEESYGNFKPYLLCIRGQL